MSKSIREDIIRKAEENLARKEAERQRAANEPERIYFLQQNDRRKFNPEKFAIAVIIGAGFVWSLVWILDSFIYDPNPEAQRLTVVVLILVPINALIAYAGYLIIRIVAKSYWEFMGCVGLIALIFGVLGLAGLIGVILVG